MQVIKLGGSLTKNQDLALCLAYIQKAVLIPTVIVPGGGQFADQVRLAHQKWQFDNAVAHEMALLAMQQTALLYRGLYPDFWIAHSISEIRMLLTEQKIVVWAPSIQELNQAAIPASWDITSDSLAAWLAMQLQAEKLVLVKAAPCSTNDLNQLSAQGVLDSAFCSFAHNACFNIQVINSRHFYAE